MLTYCLNGAVMVIYHSRVRKTSPETSESLFSEANTFPKTRSSPLKIGLPKKEWIVSQLPFPHLPVPYIYFFYLWLPGKPIYQVMIDPWFQIYKQLEDEGFECLCCSRGYWRRLETHGAPIPQHRWLLEMGHPKSRSSTVRPCKVGPKTSYNWGEKNSCYK